MDEQLKSLHKTANGTSSTIVQLSSDSLKSTSFHSYIARDVQENHHINPSRNLSDAPTEDLEHKIVQSLSNEDLNTTELPDELSGIKCSQASRDLSVAAPGKDRTLCRSVPSSNVFTISCSYFCKVSARINFSMIVQLVILTAM